MTPDAGLKVCETCGAEKPVAQFYAYSSDRKSGYAGKYRQRRCKVCAIAKVKLQKQARADSAARTERNCHYRSRFGITILDFERICSAQDGVCAVCFLPNTSGKRLAVDHDHEAGVVRGLLCDKCNRGLGLFCDSPELLRAAADYIASRRLKVAL